MLRIKGLTKRYRTGDLALKGIDLDLPDGEVMALIGPSGAGKSTVIRCINRLVEPTAGTVTLNGAEITTLGSRDLRRARRRMGMIFQEYALVERLTVMENVLSGRLGYVGFWQSFMRKFPQADVDEAFRLLARVGLDHMADKRADELSGGQRQRVGICRALIQNPELLLVDEPTASLDPKTSRLIMRLIKELCGERKLTAIINIHDVMLAQMFAERIVGLKLGEIVFDGPPTARQAMDLFICDSEKYVGGYVYLVSNVTVQIGKSRPYSEGSDSGASDIDVTAAVYPIQGRVTGYQCNRRDAMLGQDPDRNCLQSNSDPARGVCYKNTFGEWHCMMMGAGVFTQGYQPPPTGG